MIVPEAAADAWYSPILVQIRTLTQRSEPVIVAIDGRCGSGKTALSKLIARRFPCNVFHMDDYYRPLASRPKGWDKIPAGNMDLERFCAEVLEPIRVGRDVWSRPYDCRNDAYRKAVLIPCQQLTVVEGSYAHHPDLSGFYDWKIFLTCNQAVQAARLSSREGARYAGFVNTWIPLEELYIQRCQILQNADVILDTSDCF